MAQLQLSELGPAGSELFQDSESFLEELSDRELDFITGGNDLETNGADLRIHLLKNVGRRSLTRAGDRQKE